MHSAAQLINGQLYRRGGVIDGTSTIYSTELLFDEGEYLVRHLEWMDAGAPLITRREESRRANYHEAVAEFHRLLESAGSVSH